MRARACIFALFITQLPLCAQQIKCGQLLKGRIDPQMIGAIGTYWQSCSADKKFSKKADEVVAKFLDSRPSSDVLFALLEPLAPTPFASEFEQQGTRTFLEEAGFIDLRSCTSADACDSARNDLSYFHAQASHFNTPQLQSQFQQKRLEVEYKILDHVDLWPWYELRKIQSLFEIPETRTAYLKKCQDSLAQAAEAADDPKTLNDICFLLEDPNRASACKNRVHDVTVLKNAPAIFSQGCAAITATPQSIYKGTSVEAEFEQRRSNCIACDQLVNSAEREVAFGRSPDMNALNGLTTSCRDNPARLLQARQLQYAAAMIQITEDLLRKDRQTYQDKHVFSKDSWDDVRIWLDRVSQSQFSGKTLDVLAPRAFQNLASAYHTAESEAAEIARREARNWSNLKQQMRSGSYGQRTDWISVMNRIEEQEQYAYLLDTHAQFPQTVLAEIASVRRQPIPQASPQVLYNSSSNVCKSVFDSTVAELLAWMIPNPILKIPVIVAFKVANDQMELHRVVCRSN